MIISTAPSALTSVPIEFQNAAYLKFDILTNGLRLTRNAHDKIFGKYPSNRIKKPIRARSGSSGGLDIKLPGDIYVNAPIVDDENITSNVTLDWIKGNFWLICPNLPSVEISVFPEPKFYQDKLECVNIPMHKIAQMCSPDRLCYGMTGPKCFFWNEQDKCRFCSIGLNGNFDEANKKDDYLYEVISKAVLEDYWPARHIMIGGGTPPGPDSGAVMAARLCSNIKSRFDISVYVMIAAPLQNEYIKLLYDSGVDELGINLEFWSDNAWSEFIPGKKRHIGKKRYLEALKYAVDLFGPIRTRSSLVVGLESKENTLTAVKELSKIGVMPILSPFRSLKGTFLEKTRGFSTDDYIELFEEATQISHSYGIPLGPTCKCCQNNILALPFGSQYFCYGEDKET